MDHPQQFKGDRGIIRYPPIPFKTAEDGPYIDPMRTCWSRHVLPLFAVGVLAACTDAGADGPTYEGIVVGRISLPADSFTVAVGNNVTIVASAYDHRGQYLDRLPDGGSFQWTSSELTVATVMDGVVTGLRPGRSIITVRGGGQLAAARVGVEPAR